ncbi:Rho guanine nucleotide exchange factor 12 [Nymphon striatum]|nr:Rho guanine nucleotide exchange factor 12 [Nymphon striatum]
MSSVHTISFPSFLFIYSDVDVDDKAALNTSQSSSNSSLSANYIFAVRSLESPSNSLETVHKNAGGPMTAAKVDEITSSLPVGSSSQVHNSVNSPHNIHVQHHVYDDSDLEAETEAPNWQEGIEWEVVRIMKPKEKNRQDVINELFHTEKTHVRNLKVLEGVFYRPMLQEQVASSDLIGLLFGNLEEMIEVHGSINSAMKEKKQEDAIVGDIGDLMLKFFDGICGENLKQAAAKFCQNQSIALDMLRHKQRKDQKLAQFISEAEMNHLCRRLQLKDIIPTGMQRLTKYPLLLENIAKYSTGGTDEHKKVLRAVDCSKKILNFVNQSVKEAENKQRLLELQKKIDRSHFDKVDHPISHEFRNLDLARYKLIHDGSLTWRLTKQKTIDIYLLVLEQFFILLHKQDEKYVLKFHNTHMLSGRDDTKLLRSPIIKLENVLTRDNATDKKSFFLVMTSRAEHQPAIYELVARSVSEKKTWVKYIQDTCDNFKSRTLLSQPIPTLSERSESTEEPTAEPAEPAEPAETEATVKAKESVLQIDNMVPVVEQANSPVASDAGDTSNNGDQTESSNTFDPSQSTDDNTPPTPPSGGNVNGSKSSVDNSSMMDDQPTKCITTAQTPPTPPASNSSTPSSARRMQRVEILQIAEGPCLIEPSEVVVTQGAVLQTAQPVLTSIEKLRRKDEQIVTALKDKQQIVAGILNVPPEEFENIVDVVNEVTGEKEPKELVLTAIVQVNRLASILNETLRVTEEDTISASVIGTEVNFGCSSAVGTSASCAPPRSPKSPRLISKISRMPAAPTHKLMAVSKTLNQQLTELLNVIVQRDEERDQLRKELHSSQKQVRELHEATWRKSGNFSQVVHSRPDSFTSIESSTSGDICNESNALSDCCNCDNPPSDDESGTNISPLQSVVHETGIAESDSFMMLPCPDSSKFDEAEEQVGAGKEMFVDAPSDIVSAEDLLITDLDSDNEIEINVDEPGCDDDGMIVDSAEHASIGMQNNQPAEIEKKEKTDNNNDNVPQQNSMIGAIFF